VIDGVACLDVPGEGPKIDAAALAARRSAIVGRCGYREGTNLGGGMA
jgi:hypothetical protein